MLQLSKPLRPLLLVILDGWGIAPAGAGNAISLAKKPFFDSISVAYPHTQLQASGENVGLPKGEAGNSEVGHLNIGAGRIVYQDESRINSAIADGSFIHNQTFKKAFDHANNNHSRVHLIGLLGTGKVHASIEHLYALLWAAKENKVQNVFLHLFTDGRDSSPTSGLQLITELESKIAQFGIGKIATISGRYWGMDRDKNWDRVERGYDAMVNGVGEHATLPRKVVEDSYQEKRTDEFIEPTIIDFTNGQNGAVKDNDSVIFFNFRADRARELTQAFVLPNFTDFKREQELKNLFFATMTEYEEGLPVEVAFPQQKISQPLAKVVSDHQLKQLHIGESEKYAHVTYFINGGREDPFPLEDRVHIPSPKVPTYDLKPEMSALEITDYVVAKLKTDSYPFYIINYANPDMVGHTGSISATTKAIEDLDICLERLFNEVLAKDGGMVVTSDHGNAEVMLQTDNSVDTEHSTNRVPLILVAREFQNLANTQYPSGILADVAPIVLDLLGLTKPGTMTGQDLFELKVAEKISE